MKNLGLHVIYLAIIGFLAFQYWTKSQALEEAVESIVQFDKLLKINTSAVDRASIMLKNEIDKQTRAYTAPFTIKLQKKAVNAMRALYYVSQWLEKQKQDFKTFTGGFDKNDTTLLANHLSSNKSDQFFSNLKIKEIKDTLAYFQSFLSDISNEKELNEMQKQYNLPILINNNAYWQRLKYKTNADALAQLTLIQNKMQLDMIPFLNYLFNIVGSGDIKFDAYKVGIAPQKTILIEDETFIADIYLAQYSSNSGPNVSIFINNKEVPLIGGVAHFERLEQNVGKKKVEATAIIKHPLTGQTTTTKGEFEYNVLPKCHRDCK
jgi:hypothetical protein